jgi:hypothetical protein
VIMLAFSSSGQLAVAVFIRQSSELMKPKSYHMAVVVDGGMGKCSLLCEFLQL